MQYPREYKGIIYDAIMDAYGDYPPHAHPYRMGCEYREVLKFEIEDKTLSVEKQKALAYRASENVSNNKIIPNGVRLIGCDIIREDYDMEEK
jgi:hypothetical protein